VTREVLGLNPNDAAPVVGDIRRITYWLTEGGLARQELKIITSDDVANLMPPGLPDEGQYVIAEEVRGVKFEYFDGTDWQDSWDGTTPGADNVTPIGPPRAIRITVGLVKPGAGPDAPVRTHVHVVAIPTANGTTPQSTTTGGGTTTP
jgi:hypothetical protein